MALKKCKKCENEVSTTAKKCPNCGAYLHTLPAIGCLVIVGVMILFGIIGSFLEDGEYDNSTMAYIMMEEFVKERLVAPKTAEFPGTFDGRVDHIQHLGDQKYRINSYVDAQNSFGATIRNNFTGEIEQVSEDRWRLNSLEIGPQ